MIVGIHSRENDLVVNPIKAKKLTNVRASGKDENVVLTPPIRLSLELAIEFIDDDELVEVTPKSVRVRKRFLKEHERRRASRTDTGGAGGRGSSCRGFVALVLHVLHQSSPIQMEEKASKKGAPFWCAARKSTAAACSRCNPSRAGSASSSTPASASTTPRSRSATPRTCTR